MKILVVSSSYPTLAHPQVQGGTERFSIRLCEELVKRGNEVCVVRSGPVWDKWDRESINGVDVITVPTRNLYSPWQSKASNSYVRAVWHIIEDYSSAPPEFDRILRDFAPDILHTNSLYGLTTDIWSMARDRQIPVVHTLHDYYLICARSRLFKNSVSCESSCFSCNCLTRGRKRATAYVDTIVSVSERTLSIHRERGLFNNGGNQVIIRNPPPVLLEPVKPVEAKVGKIVFGFIGRPSDEKGVFDLLSNFRKLPKGAARLLIAGDANSEMRARLLDCIGDSDVEILGFVTPATFFKRIDVMIVPSLWEEPSPMVIGESFAYMRPVIGTRRGGIPELIGDKIGWLYEPNSSELEGLLSSISNSREVIAAKSRHLSSTANQRNFDDLVTEYFSVYSDTIAKKERPGQNVFRPPSASEALAP